MFKSKLRSQKYFNSFIYQFSYLNANRSANFHKKKIYSKIHRNFCKAEFSQHVIAGEILILFFAKVIFKIKKNVRFQNE